MARAFVLIGGSRSQLGLLENARALGYEVCVVDGLDSAPLLAEADHRIVRSFTEVDRVLADLENRGAINIGRRHLQLKDHALLQGEIRY